MKKILLLVLASTALTVALFGCGGGGGGGGGGDLSPITVPGAGFAGSYSGKLSPVPSYITDSNSNKEWRMNVRSAGDILGHTDNYATGGTISGTINSTGAFTAVQDGGSNGDITLTGTVDASGNVSGNWVWNKTVASSTPATGTFSGTKEVIPVPRFTDTGKGTIYDAFSNLTWLKNTDCFGLQSGFNAVTKASTLASPNVSCGLSDSSVAGNWRLPTIGEMQIIVEDGYLSDAIITAGFLNVRSDYYWSGTTNQFNINEAWGVNMSYGSVASLNMGNTYYVWPVRNGQ